MSLFNNYQNGRGIPKYTPKKKGLALFFDLFFRKSGSITLLNLLFFIFCLPLYVAFFLIGALGDNTELLLIFLLILSALFAATIGPAIAGMTKVMRLFLIEKHSFVARDFFRGFKENFKNGFIVGIADIVAVLSLIASYNVYPYCVVKYDNNLFYVPMVLSFSVGIVVLVMNYYIFPMMVATDLSLKNLIKNSFALAFISIKENILSTIFIAIFAAVMFLILLYFFPLFFLLSPVFPAALAWFVVCFISYPVIQKFIINPYYDQRGEVNPELLSDAETAPEEAVFEDMGGKEEPIKKRKKTKGKRIS